MSASANGPADGTTWTDHSFWTGTDTASSMSVSNGVLTLNAVEQSNGSYTQPFLSSVNSSGQGFTQLYGFFEARIWTPAGDGAWPAFWLMSDAHVQNAAAVAAEIDIMEEQGSMPDTYWATLHQATGNTGGLTDAFNANHEIDTSENLTGGWHTYGVLWSDTTDTLTFYLDGKAMITVPDYSTTNLSPMEMNLNLATGGWTVGTDSTTPSDLQMKVDWVRVYQFADQDPTAVTAQSGYAAEITANGASVSGATVSSPTTSSITPSANGTVVTGTSGSIETAAGNVFAIDSAGQITENGSVLSATNSVTELAYINGTVYQEATSQNLWWSFDESTGQWTETSNPQSTTAQAPTLSVAAAGGNEGSSIALSITAAQASSSLSAADLTLTVSGLDGATLNHGTLNADGSYTLQASQLSGLTVTPASGFTGTLALSVTATDTEASSGTSASSAVETLDVTVNPVAETPTLSVHAASGSEGTAIALAISAAQSASSLSAADLTLTVSGLDGATLNHGTLNADGSYTLHESDLSGLTLTPESGFTGTLALSVTATDTEASSATTASTAAETLDVTVDPTATTPTVSANDTVVAGTQGSIDTAAHNVFAIDASGQVTENGTALTETNSVTELAYVNGILYQEATTQNLWWSYNETTNQWTETSDPLSSGNGGGAPSANDTVVAGTSGDIVSAAHNVFAIDAAGQITENGTVLSDTNSVTELAYVNGTVYQEATSLNLWWSLNETSGQWTETSDPVGSVSLTPSADDTVVAGTNGSIVSAAHNVFAIDTAGQITENGAVLSDTSSVTELAYVGGTVYQEATSQNLWWSYNETTTQWTQTTDPLPSSTTAGVLTGVQSGGQDVYTMTSLAQAGSTVANFASPHDILDLIPLMKSIGYTGTTAAADHVTLVQEGTSTAVMIEPPGSTHAETLVTLQHVLPQAVHGEIWY